MYKKSGNLMEISSFRSWGEGMGETLKVGGLVGKKTGVQTEGPRLGTERLVSSAYGLGVRQTPRWEKKKPEKT